MATPLAGVLVTATPTVQGYPTISGYTDSAGQVVLPLNPNLQYNLTFSGPAIGKVYNFKSQNATFTLAKLKNTGSATIKISGVSLPANKSLFVLKASYPVSVTVPSGYKFKSWTPSTYFSKYNALATKFIMPLQSISVKAIITKLVTSKLYVVDGLLPKTSPKIYNTANHAYNPSTNTWSTKASDPTGRAALATGVINSKMYAVDGYAGSYLKTNHAYDPSTNTWSTKASDASGRGYLAAGVIGSKIYVVDGAYLTANHAYDPSTNTWSTKASDLTKRGFLAAGVIGSKMYAVDGVTSNNTYLKTNNAYDPSTNTWSTKASDTTGRAALAAGVIGSKIYAVDGITTNNTYLKTNHAYDPSTNTWSTKASDASGRGYLAAGVIA